jgi:hypothetical protein
LPECTRTPRRFARTQALLLAALSLAASAWFAASARADGDPASDVLATQSLFLPQDASVPAAQREQLRGLLEEARRAGDPIRVAVVASPADLGSVTALWRQPRTYSRFLGQELSLGYRGLLLVVMPNGYGVFHQAAVTPVEQGALAGIRPPGGRPGAATVEAVQRLAASSGHALPVPSATPPSAATPSDATPWVVFAIGAVLIGVAWTASIRARPLRHSSG